MGEAHHSMKRRCFVHDYKGRSIYLITLEVAGRRRVLGRIRGADAPRTGQGHGPDDEPRTGQGHGPDDAPHTGQGGGPDDAPRTEQGGGQDDAPRTEQGGGPDDAPRTGQGHGPDDEPRTGQGDSVEIPLSVAGLSEAELAAVNAPLFAPSELGRRVAEEFIKIGEHVAGVKSLLAQAMPDHFHGILFVTREIDRSLGSIMAGFKGKCSQIARELGVTQALTRRAPNGAASGGAAVTPSLWEEGFHDRILTSEGQLEKMFRYVIDNPRRLALRLKYPDLFTSVKCLAGHGHTFEAYGNGFLLQRDTIAQVQCSRKFFGFKREEKLGQMPGAPNLGLKVTREVAFETPEFAAKKGELFAAAKKGAVLCSPCISDGEKAIAYAAVDAGHSLIVLRNEPFPPRFKPSGRFFDACAEGRLLMLYPQGLTPRAPNRDSLTPRALNRDSLAPRAPNRQGTRITRTECLALNAIVAEICGGNAGDIIYQGLGDGGRGEKGKGRGRRR